MDIWSAGCIIAEFLIGRPIYAGASSMEQIIEIMKVIGTPTPEEMQAMNPKQKNYKFPKLKLTPLSTLLPKKTDEVLIDLLCKTFKYDPNERLTA